MPNLRIETNVDRTNIKELEGFLKELSAAVAASLGKPEQYVMVQVIPSVPMMFGGSDAPCASAFFLSIGKMGPEVRGKQEARGGNLPSGQEVFGGGGRSHVYFIQGRSDS